MGRIHQEVLRAANQIASTRPDWSFAPVEVVRALPQLNESSVRTHIVSRCCIDAPKNHPHKWNYFRRKGRSEYQVAPEFRARPAPDKDRVTGKSASHPMPGRARATLHAVAQQEGGFYWAECLELPVVTQGRSLDELLANLREAVALHLQDEDLASLGIAPNPSLQLLYEASLLP